MVEQEVRGVQGRVARPQLRSVCRDEGIEVGDRLRRCGDPEPGRDRPDLGDVGVGVGRGEPAHGIRLERHEEGLRLGGMDPGEEVRIACGVRGSVAGYAVDAAVDAADPGEERLGVRDRRVGGRGDGVARALQPAPGVALEAGVAGDAGHGQRVERLDEECPQPADHHRGVTVHPPDRVTRPEPAWSGSAPDPFGPAVVRAGDPGSHRPRNPGTDRVEDPVSHGTPWCGGSSCSIATTASGLSGP